MARLEDGPLARVHRDAGRFLEDDAEKRKAVGRGGPTGRGGGPLGVDRSRELSRIFDLDGMRFVSDFMSNELGDFEIELTDFLDSRYSDMFNAGGRGARLALGVSSNFDLRNPAIANALTERANLLAGNVAQSTFDRLRTVIADQFYLRGESPIAVARVLEEEFDFLSRDRAERIARTETGAVTSEAQHAVYSASGVHFKRWLCTLDGRERETHFEAHGQIQAIDEPFIVGGAELMFPLDPDGPIEEIINCRCDHLPIVTADQVMSDADVWAGDVDPDEFANEA